MRCKADECVRCGSQVGARGALFCDRCARPQTKVTSKTVKPAPAASPAPIGYLNVAHSTYFRAADFVLNDGTRALLASGEIVALYAGAAPAASALLKLCGQLDMMKRRLRAIPSEGQRESYYVADDVDCCVEEARVALERVK